MTLAEIQTAAAALRKRRDDIGADVDALDRAAIALAEPADVTVDRLRLTGAPTLTSILTAEIAEAIPALIAKVRAELEAEAAAIVAKYEGGK